MRFVGNGIVIHWFLRHILDVFGLLIRLKQIVLRDIFGLGKRSQIFGIGVRIALTLGHRTIGGRIERGNAVRIKFSVRQQIVDYRAAELPLHLIAFEESSAFRLKGIVDTLRTIGDVAFVGADVAELFQPFETAVKSGLFEHIQPLALFFDLVQNFIAVLILVAKRSEDDGVHMGTYQVYVYVGSVHIFSLYL